jgi:hypothetical protein
MNAEELTMTANEDGPENCSVLYSKVRTVAPGTPRTGGQSLEYRKERSGPLF